uniref:NADH dehydrogenase subunit 4L n=1 Tax=Cellana orientalis TaxID=351212 RepID=UPI002028EF58|nr:NADH dehydrogenase subunit 4L [Cellana orientalis]UPX89391.1 NADH dehydrogenase subunit 4L [Cellana orientalis]
MTYNFMMIISIMLIFTVLLSIMLQMNHIIMMLLLFEKMALSIFIMITYKFLLTSMNSTPLILFLTLSVCEASLGLAILVSIIRANGNDYVSSLSMNKF